MPIQFNLTSNDPTRVQTEGLTEGASYAITHTGGIKIQEDATDAGAPVTVYSAPNQSGKVVIPILTRAKLTVTLEGSAAASVAITKASA